MKSLRIFSLILLLAIMLTGFASCSDDNNEELIIQRVEDFLTAFNNGSTEEMIACFDEETRNQMNSTIDIVDGALESDVNIKTLIDFGSNFLSDYTSIKVSKVKIESDEYAVVTSKLKIFGPFHKKIYFGVVYENEGWYIEEISITKI